MSKIKLIYHRVNTGETLQSISDRYYGDFKQWPYLQAINGVVNPGNLHKGQMLAIPPISSFASVERTIDTNFANSPVAATRTLEVLARRQERLNPGLGDYRTPGIYPDDAPVMDDLFVTITTPRLPDPEPVLETVDVQAARIPWYAWAMAGLVAAMALRK